MELVLRRGEKITTTSMIIAEVFEREHKDVLKSIRELDCSEEFSRRNFAPSDYTVRGKKYPIYYITKDGFMMLVMGFTGKKAATFKEMFIEQFNRMAMALTAPKTPKLIPTYQKRILSMAARDCPDDMWNVFDESSEMMLLIEKEIGSINQYDLIDGSIGIHWAKYREGKPWAVTYRMYYHQFEDQRGTQQCKCYQFSEIKHFRMWMRRVYKPMHLPEYLKKKFKSDKIMYTRVQAFLPKLLPKKAS